MSMRRINVLLKKEFRYGYKSYFFIYAVIAPIMATLLINLVFGPLLSGKPKMGIFDPGNSQIVNSLRQMGSISLVTYASETELRDAVKTGDRDVGVVLEKNFDNMIKMGISTELKTYIWGESLLKNRAIADSALMVRVRHISGKKSLVDIIPVFLGDKKNVPWQDRIFPSIILMAIFISGFAIPSTSLVEEKEKRTLGAVLTTPVKQSDIFISKGLTGIIVSMIMGISILMLNQSFNTQLGLITLLLFLGAIMATCLGLILGAFMKEVSSVYSVLQGLGIFIYAPAIFYLFPSIPKWVGKFFPTYYVLNPLMEITRGQGTWSTVYMDFLILIGILVILMIITLKVSKITQQHET